MLVSSMVAASLGGAWIQLGALGAGLAGLFVVLRRRQPNGVRPHSIPLTGQHAVHIIDTEGARLVVGTGPGAAPQLLCRLPTPTDRSAPPERPDAPAPPRRAGWD